MRKIELWTPQVIGLYVVTLTVVLAACCYLTVRNICGVRRMHAMVMRVMNRNPNPANRRHGYELRPTTDSDDEGELEFT